MPYSIEKRPGGLFITFTGDLTLAEISNWRTESTSFVMAYSEPFGVIIDMRGLRPLTPDMQSALIDAQRYYRENGMSRSAVIAPSRLLMAQLQRIANTTGLAQSERYFNGALNGWAKQAVDWVRYGKEPNP